MSKFLMTAAQSSLAMLYAECGLQVGDIFSVSREVSIAHYLDREQSGYLASLIGNLSLH